MLTIALSICEKLCPQGILCFDIRVWLKDGVQIVFTTVSVGVYEQHD